MNQKPNCILLVDDSLADNFYHKMVIESAGYTNGVIVKQTAMEALTYLKSKDEASFPKPELIFLDINMPGMNGWDFLNEYQKLDKEHQGKVVVIMLTTSLNPDDAENARQFKVISGFEIKPLTRDSLFRVFQENFASEVKSGN